MDRILRDGLLRSLFDWAPLHRFLASVLGLPKLYPYGDLLAGLMINVNCTGEQLGWHFNNAEFAVTLMLQPPEAGGAFRYLPNIRAGDAAEASAVSAVLDCDETGLIDLAPPAGTLVIFRGRDALHCAVPVTGPRPCLVGVLSYAREPNQRMDATSQLLFRGVWPEVHEDDVPETTVSSRSSPRSIRGQTLCELEPRPALNFRFARYSAASGVSQSISGFSRLPR